MAKEFSKSFYNSKKWKDVRSAYVLSKFGICERCGKTNSKQVHHKVYLTSDNIDNPDISLSFENLKLPCDVCHQKEHFEKYSPIIYGLTFDMSGQLVKKEQIKNEDKP